MKEKNKILYDEYSASCLPQEKVAKDSKDITPEQYVWLKECLLRDYSNPNLYVRADTPSGNVYVYSEHYRRYLAHSYSRKLMSILTKEIQAGEVFGKVGFQIFILPERVYIADRKYKGSIPDALMNGHLVEFKKLESNTYDSFQRNLSNGLKKSDIVYVELQDALLDMKGDRIGYRNALFGEVKKHDYPLKYVVVSVKGEDATFFEIKIGHPTNGTPLGEVRLSHSSI